MRAWWSGRDPGLRWTRRAIRIAVAASVGFFVALYGLGDSVMSLYASFGVIALGGLSEVVGTPGERARTYTVAAGVGVGLVTLGTWLSVTTLTAALGMIVVGFGVAYAGVGGPAVAGVANGLQLLYILPSFPPFDPGSLGSRIAGLGLALVCLLLVDRFLLPPPVPEPYEHSLATAVDALADRVGVVRRLMDGAVVPDREREAVEATAKKTLETSRISAQPPLRRPSGPDRCSRALWYAASAVRESSARVDDLQAALTAPDLAHRPHRGTELLGQAQRGLLECAAGLRGGPAPDPRALDDAITDGLADRGRWLVEAVADDEPLDARTAVGSRTFEVAAGVRGVTLAVRLARGAPLPDDPAAAVDRRLFWYAEHGDPRLLLLRLRAQLDVHSVWFQNAVRVAVALATARALAGVLDFSHGFWVLLATLTLLRTTASATRSAVRPALLGTLAGALLAVPFLVILAPDPLALAVLLPLLIVAAFALGPVVGAPYGQAALTLVVAALFAQVAPASWSLAGWRLLDVAVGALVGIGAGLLAWPRGASGQLVRQCSEALRCCADVLVATTRELGVAAPPAEEVTRRARHVQLLTSETVAFAMGEPVASGLGRHWREILAVCRHMSEGGEYVRLRRVGSGPLPWPEAVGLLDTAALDDARAARAAAAALPGQPTSDRASADGADPTDTVFADWLRRTVAADAVRADPAVLDVIDARAWLVAVRRDLARLGVPGVQ